MLVHCVQAERAAYNVITMMSMFSCRFLHVDARVSEVPNSKYHNLLRILDAKIIYTLPSGP